MKATMQMSRLIAAVAAVAMAFVPAVSQAADATIGADVASSYVWRGLTFNDGLVVQPSLDVSSELGFGFNVWGNFDIEDYGGAVNKREFSEVDLTASYTPPLEGPVSVTIGIIEYLFPKEGDYSPELPAGHADVDGAEDTDTREVFVSVGYAVIDGLDLAVDGYYDIDQVEDYYVGGSISYGVDITDDIAIGASTGIGYAGKDWANYYAGGTDAGFFDWSISGSATYALTDSVEIGGFVTYVSNVNDDTLPDDAMDKDVYGGGSVYVSF